MTDLEAMEEGVAAGTPREDARGNQAHSQHTSMKEYNAEGTYSKEQDSPQQSLQGDSAQ